MKNYYQKEIETASREEILKIQNEKIVKQVKHVYDNVPYYRNLMDQKGVKPEDIQSVDDIKKLPFLSKDDLREAYPYGLLGTDLKKCVRIQSTSGTAAPERSSLPAALTRMLCRSRTATASSPAAPASTAVLTRSAA